MSLNIVSINKFDEICRVCLKENQSLTVLYDQTSEVNLISKFKVCTSVQFDENDGLPNKICDTCVKELLAAYNFAIKCKINDAALRKHLIYHHNSALPKTRNEQYQEVICNEKTITDKLELTHLSEVDLATDLSSNTDTLYMKMINCSNIYEITSNNKTLHPQNEQIINTEAINIVNYEQFADVKPNEEGSAVDIDTRYELVSDITFENETVDLKSANNLNLQEDKVKIFKEDIENDFDKIGNDRRELRIKLMRIDAEEKNIDDDGLNSQSKIVYDKNVKSFNTNKRYLCELCPKTFRRVSSLKQHERSHQEDMNEDAASSTDYGDNDYDNNLETEATYDGDLSKKYTKKNRIYKCDKCHQKFNRANDLLRHKTIYSVKCQYKCKICFKILRSAITLKIHKLSHNSEKPYTCDICRKSFALPYTLNLHQKVHSSEKPYKCSICPKAFRWPNNLLRHEIVHTNIRPFQCPLCEKRFRFAYNLKTHERCHTGKQSYSCNMCSSAFYSASSLLRHKRIHKAEVMCKAKICEILSDRGDT